MPQGIWWQCHLFMCTAKALIPAHSPQPLPLHSLPFTVGRLEMSIQQDKQCLDCQFNERSLWVFWAPQTKCTSLCSQSLSDLLGDGTSMWSSYVHTTTQWPTPHCHHSETTSCHSHLLLRKTIFKGAQDLLTLIWMHPTTKLGTATTLGGLFYPLPSSFSSSKKALHEPVF